MPINQAIFENSFNAETLTVAINETKYKPHRIGALQLFQESGIWTTDLQIEAAHGVLNLLPNIQRGAPATIHKRGGRKMVKATTAHFVSRSTLYADSIQNRREFGGNAEMDAVRERNRILQEMRDNHDATLEHQRIGAIKGLVQDVNGQTLIDLYAAFEVTQQVKDMDLDSDATIIRRKCMDVKRAIEDVLGAMAYKGVHVLCSTSFFDQFTEHPAVTEAYKRWQDGEFARSDVRSGFQFADMTFEEYRGMDGEEFIGAGDAYALPLGVPDLFVSNFAPADYMETVNTEGLPYYAKAEMGPMGRFVSIESQCNPISLCTRPRSIVKLTA